MLCCAVLLGMGVEGGGNPPPPVVRCGVGVSVCLCCALLCCAVLCCAVLCCSVLCCAVVCSACSAVHECMRAWTHYLLFIVFHCFFLLVGPRGPGDHTIWGRGRGRGGRGSWELGHIYIYIYLHIFVCCWWTGMVNVDYLIYTHICIYVYI